MEHHTRFRPGHPNEYREVVITAGGTREPIDNVRYIGNFSGGRLGVAMAIEYASHGHNVTLLSSKSVTDRYSVPSRVSTISFDTTESLKNALLRIRSTDLVLHAAAVSDYTPIPTSGKISSEQENLTMTLIRTPKILPLLRDHFGESTTIVGFKLLSDNSTERLLSVAHSQIEHSATNYCIANLLEDIGPNERIVHVVRPTDVQTIAGETRQVANGIYHAIKWGSRNEALRG